MGVFPKTEQNQTKPNPTPLSHKGSDVHKSPVIVVFSHGVSVGGKTHLKLYAIPAARSDCMLVGGNSSHSVLVGIAYNFGLCRWTERKNSKIT